MFSWSAVLTKEVSVFLLIGFDSVHCVCVCVCVCVCDLSQLYYF